MTYIQGELGVDGELKATRTVEVDQKKLTSDCWPVQMVGLGACATCPAKDTPDCGGGESLRRLQAEASPTISNEPQH